MNGFMSHRLARLAVGEETAEIGPTLSNWILDYWLMQHCHVRVSLGVNGCLNADIRPSNINGMQISGLISSLLSKNL